MVLHPSTTPRLKVHIIDQIEQLNLSFLISITPQSMRYSCSARSNTSSTHNHVFRSTTPTSSAHDATSRAHAPNNPPYSSQPQRPPSIESYQSILLLPPHGARSNIGPSDSRKHLPQHTITVPIPPPRILRSTSRSTRPTSNSIRPPRQLVTPDFPRPRTKLAPRSLGIDPQSRHITVISLARLQRCFWQHQQRRRALVKSRSPPFASSHESRVSGVQMLLRDQNPASPWANASARGVRERRSGSAV